MNANIIFLNKQIIPGSPPERYYLMCASLRGNAVRDLVIYNK